VCALWSRCSIRWIYEIQSNISTFLFFSFCVRNKRLQSGSFSPLPMHCNWIREVFWRFRFDLLSIIQQIETNRRRVRAWLLDNSYLGLMTYLNRRQALRETRKTSKLREWQQVVSLGTYRGELLGLRLRIRKIRKTAGLLNHPPIDDDRKSNLTLYLFYSNANTRGHSKELNIFSPWVRALSRRKENNNKWGTRRGRSRSRGRGERQKPHTITITITMSGQRRRQRLACQ